jgi:hypothetical protein
MTRIRVDTELLRSEAGHLDATRDVLDRLGQEVARAAAAMPSYDGQLSGPARAAGWEARSRASGLAIRHADQAQRLTALASAFEAADRGPIDWWEQFVQWVGKEVADMENWFTPRPALPPLPVVPTPVTLSTPIGTQTPGASAIPTPTAVPSINKIRTGTILQDTNVRTSPEIPQGDATKNLLLVSASPLSVKILMEERHAGWTWYQVVLPDNRSGWVRADRIDISIDISSLSILPGSFTDGLVVDHSSLIGFWGKGKSGDWNLFSMNGYLYQFLNILGYHLTNICGPLAIMQIVAESDLTQGFTRFKGIAADYWDGQKQLLIPCTGEYLLKNNMASTLDTMLNFFRSYHYAADWGKDPSIEQIISKLNSQKGIIVQVGIDQFHNGVVVTDLKRQNAQHWISIESAFQTTDGTVWVKVYNPAMNTEEYYRWETIAISMHNNDNIYIEASKPN